MQRRPILVSTAFAATLFSLCCAALAQSGVIRFSGMIVEPPCTFSLSTPGSARPQLRSECPRPAAGNVAFIDHDSQKILRTVSFTQTSRPIGVPTNSGDGTRRIVAVVTYQ
jgi:type 1 fimbria pilin